MNAAGFLISPNSAQPVTTAWAAFLLAEVVAASANSKAFGGQAYFTDLELDLDTVAGGATAVQVTLTYDSVGLSALYGPSASTAFAVLAAAKGTVVIPIDRMKVLPARAAVMPTTAQCYVWMRTNAGTCNVTAGGARLQWRDAPV